MLNREATAANAEIAIIGHLKVLMEMSGPGMRGAALTGALYAVIRMMHAARPSDQAPDRFAFGVLSSATTAMVQLDPSPDYKAEEATGNAEAVWLQLMGEVACTMTQHLADTLHERAANGGPCCPMSGIVPGLIAGATYAAVNNRDPDEVPTAAGIREYVVAVVDATIAEAAARDGIPADAIGEVQGNG